MMMRCNHLCEKMGPQYQSVWVLRGQFLLSNVKLAEIWGWDEKTVRRFVKYLASENMVKVFSFNKFTIYELTKYAEFQALDAEAFQEYRAEQKPSRSRPRAEQKPTNKNLKNLKNLKEVIHKKPSPSKTKTFLDDDKEIILSKRLFDLMLINNPNAKEPNWQTWAKSIDLAIRVDRRTVEQLETIIDWCQKDTFWLTNILSTGKLRDQFDKLTLAMKKPRAVNKQKDSQRNNFDQRDMPDDFNESFFSNTKHI